MIPSEILSSVIHIKYGGSVASAFVISNHGKAFVVSAKHIFPGCNYGDVITFEIFRDSDWHSISGSIYMSSDSSVDIVVIATNENRESDKFEINGVSLLGQDCYFLGFPFGLKLEDVGKINNGFPFPFVKKAIISSFSPAGGPTMFYLDGHNNKGFSGGPVVIQIPNQPNKWRVIGVVSGYLSSQSDINTVIGTIQTTENAGIISSYGSRYIMEIIAGIPSV